jgi:hypothetical protein
MMGEVSCNKLSGTWTWLSVDAPMREASSLRLENSCGWVVAFVDDDIRRRALQQKSFEERFEKRCCD